jgi:uncharacterized protein (DUF2147 family)
MGSTLGTRFGTRRLAIGLACALAALSVAAPLRAQDGEQKTEPNAAGKAEPSAAGLWQQMDSSGRVQGWFQIGERGGVYQGTIVKMFLKEGEDPNPVCTRCEGALHNAPWLGMTIITGMKRDGLAYEGGRILDPRSGSVYSAQMKLSPDGQTLTVRGYLGVSALGQNQTWKRLPESAHSQVDRTPKTQGSAKR